MIEFSNFCRAIKVEVLHWWNLWKTIYKTKSSSYLCRTCSWSIEISHSQTSVKNIIYFLFNSFMTEAVIIWTWIQLFEGVTILQAFFLIAAQLRLNLTFFKFPFFKKIYFRDQNPACVIEQKCCWFENEHGNWREWNFD